MKSNKETEREREVLAMEIVHAVIEDLRVFGMIKEVGDTQFGMAISEAAQHIEARLPLVK